MNKNRTFLIFLGDFCLITVSFFLATYLKKGNFVLNTEYRYLLFFFYSIWFISSIISKKYNLIRPKSFRQGLQPLNRSFLYMAALLFFIIFIFKLFYYSRFIILATLIIYFFLEISAYGVFYSYSWGPNVNIGNEDYNCTNYAITEELQDDEIGIDTKGRRVNEPLKSKLKERYLEQYQKIHNFIDSAINLDAINASDSLVLDVNIDVIVYGILNSRLEFVCNLHKINDIRRLNKFFRAVNKKLIKGGYFVGVAETVEQRLKRKFSRYSKYLRKFLHFLDFFWTRVFPELPVIKIIYFIIHGKDRRIISKCETLGRLYFCGFSLVDMKEIDKKLYFIVKKVRSPIEDKDPSYGLIFKQKRIGTNGEIILTYKFRTMLPYSEYIHKYMYEQNKLNQIGKIKDDIRITNWGRTMRKYWIDELPMLINLLQGDLKLVGFRAISESFLSIYPEDLRKERLKYKSGLIPALYADMPNSTEEIWESEKKYLKKYKRHPWRTDFIYFFKVINNILFQGVRSE